jgi:NitT/TauT family transport system permease protein
MAKADPPDRRAARGAARRGLLRGFFAGFFRVRDEPTIAGRALMGGLFLALLLAAWTLATRGEAERRMISPEVLGSPAEVLRSLPSLWFDRALTRNLAASLWRVLQGFALAALVGVPLGVLAGAFKRIDAFLAPASVFGRNVPISTLVPLTLLWFGTGEGQKIAFIFIACVAFVLFDAARSVSDVPQDYLDTAYTLGANRRQTLLKVLVPLALPDVVNSLRLLFGLAFGYIILAEMIDMNAGIGKLILASQRRGPREHVYLILAVITITAYGIDRALWALQKRWFPYRYGRR